MGIDEKSKILIFGATGYLGKYLIKASISMGHPTYAYVRPVKSDSTDPSKLQLLKDFESIGRFVPSEYGNEVDRVRGALPPFQKLLDNKKKIRRATEEAGISFTYVSANTFAAYFIDLLLHPHHPSDEVTLYGDGKPKAVFNYEEDIAVYTLKAATDPRVANRVIIYRPPKNIISQLDLVAAWEHKTGRTIKRKHVPEQEIITLSQNLPFPDNIPVAILHNMFIAGTQVSFELTDNDLEASKLYPEHNYTSVDDLLNRCLVDPPKTKLAAFA
ncbi:hypothetical protein DH2020_015752 [Rehmannia glutinosa]|uniref:NmrA-like domain-containing protein n=1 Tax=Rehmannia glutinosa TaxID=99300 RepID=A0ABR0WX92_REHGL